MVRKVSGYLTSSGAYFDTKAQAYHHEAVYGYEQAALEFFGFLPQPMREVLMDKVKEFVLTHREIVIRYAEEAQPYIPPEEPTFYEPNTEDGVYTGPVSTLDPEPEDVDDDAAFQTFTEALGTYDPGAEATGDDEVVRQPGESPPDVPE